MAVTINTLKSFSGLQKEIQELHVLKSPLRTEIIEYMSHSTLEDRFKYTVSLFHHFKALVVALLYNLLFGAVSHNKLYLNSAISVNKLIITLRIMVVGKKCTSFPSMCTLGAMISFRCHLTKSPQPHRPKQSSTGTFSRESASEKKIIFSSLCLCFLLAMCLDVLILL